MKPTCSNRVCVLAACAAFSAGAGSISASTICINTVDSIPGLGSTVAGFKLRASPTNWDASLSNNSATANPNDFLSGNLSNSFSGLGATITFTIENRPGQGFIFTTDRSSGSGHSTITLGWGDFTPAISATRQATSLNGIQPGLDFNTLAVDATSTLTGSNVRVRNLVFNAPGMTITGGFDDANLNAAAISTNSQWLVSDTNLASIPWTLSGEVRLGRSNSAGGDEQVKFTVMARQGGSIPVAANPEPGSALLVGLTLTAAARRRHR